MPLRPLNRQQTWLFPPTLDELIPDDHPVRFVATLVDSLGESVWQKLGIGLEGDPLGAPAYNPRALLCVWLYGFMTGTRSSRKLESACRDQMPYLWLTGWQHPDHNTLWRFYKEHRDEMRHLFKLSVRTAVSMGLVDMAVQAVDGTKIAANAAKERTYDAKELEKLLEHTEEVIKELERENEEGNEPPPVHLPEKLRKAEQLRTEVKVAMERLAEEETERINLTDDEANLMKGRQGIIAGYNVQAMVSPLKTTEIQTTTGRIITAVDTVQDSDDHSQLIPMMVQAEENTAKKADMTLSDAGYHSGANLAGCSEREQAIAMPESQERALKEPFHKDNFTYNLNTDSYTCPCGEILRFVFTRNSRGNISRIYRSSGAVCRQCTAFGICTKYKDGRELQIGSYDMILKLHRAWMETPEAKRKYALRKELPEPVFGIIKEQMGYRRFLLRGWNNVRAEAVMIATAFNLRTLYRVWQRWTARKRTLLDSICPNLGNKIGGNLTLSIFKGELS